MTIWVFCVGGGAVVYLLACVSLADRRAWLGLAVCTGQGQKGITLEGQNVLAWPGGAAVEDEKRGDMRPVGDLELTLLMMEMFGTRRSMELVGWAVRWGLTGEADDIAGARRRLIEEGLGRSSVYRAMADFRLLRERIDATEGGAITMRELVGRLVSGIPQVVQTVVQS